MHDASKVLFGMVGSSDRVITAEAADPADFLAGRAVRRTIAGGLSLSSADGQLIGVSLGKSLSDTKKTAVCRVGNKVPLELAGYAYLAKADLTFYTKVNASVAIEFLDTETAGDETVTVTGDDEDGYLISVAIEDGVSTGTQVKAALDASEEAAAIIETVITGTAGDPQDAFAEDDIDGLIAVVGAAVRVSNTDGKGVPSGGTLTGAHYSSGLLTGIKENAAEIPAAILDMAGGL